jgi:hypothetical protein
LMLKLNSTSEKKPRTFTINQLNHRFDRHLLNDAANYNNCP